MFKDGKLFGKINIVDMAVILIVVLLIIGATIKFGKFNSKTEESTSQNIEYKVEVKNIRGYTVDALQIGDLVYDSQTGISIGSITNIEKTNAKTYESLITGDVVLVENPYKYDVVITVETPGSVETDAYYANKTIELKVNSVKVIETKYTKTSGTISDIKVK